MKRIIIIIAFVSALLVGCKSSDKSTAYCFSALFENSEGSSNITLYCKKNAENGLETVEVNVSGESFIEAIENTVKTDYEVFFGSNKAIFFSENVTKKERLELILFFLNHAKYHSTCKVYSAGNGNLASVAKAVCDNEKINYSESNNYMDMLKYAKNLDENEVR